MDLENDIAGMDTKSPLLGPDRARSADKISLRRAASYGSVLPENVVNRSDSLVDSPPRQETEMTSRTKYKSGESSGEEEFVEKSVAWRMNQLLRTGRQRKRDATRSKGGEFQQKRRKRRIHFCCVGNEANVEMLAEKYADGFLGMRGKLYDEVLHLYVDGAVVAPITGGPSPPPVAAAGEPLVHLDSRATNTSGISDVSKASGLGDESGLLSKSFDAARDNLPAAPAPLWQGKEAFVFDFGAVVFWGFPREDEESLLQTIRSCAGGLLSHEEFEIAEDDMAFVLETSPDVTEVAIANDVVTLPIDASVQMRLAVSFAIAQSSVLSIFEARIEKKIEEYKYIPETLSVAGKINLSSKKLGVMIGEVFVIRHDVNLHSEILNTPDFFWKEQRVLPVYGMTMTYLEMTQRTEVLNLRLDLVKELLRVLQQQHENAHNVKLEWVVIWLIVISCVLELSALAGEMLGLWKV